MHLHLLNEYTSHNLGDAAIYETLVQLAAPRATVSSLGEDARRHVRDLVPSAPGLLGGPNVSVGGDIFNNARPRFLTRCFLKNVALLNAAPAASTFVFGQSIPQSCRGLSMAMLARVLRRISSVTVRDAESHHRLRTLGVAAELSHDLAFAYRPRPGCADAGRALFERAGVDADRTVLLSVRGFDAMYPHDNQRFVARMADLAVRLISRGHQAAVLVQSAANGADSDREVIDRLRARVPHIALLDPFEVGGGHHPLDALIGVVGQAQAVVAVRFHAAVLRLLAGRVPYSLHYSVKGRDLTQRLGLPGTDLDAFDPAAAVAQVEASAVAVHDPQPQATHVRQSFAAALARAALASTEVPEERTTPSRAQAGGVR